MPGLYRNIFMFESLSGIFGRVPADERLENISSIGALGAMILNVSLGIAFSISIIMFGFGAFRYVLSSGDPKLIEKAYHTMFWSFLAALVSILAIAIKNVVAGVAGVTDPNIINGTPGF